MSEPRTAAEMVFIFVVMATSYVIGWATPGRIKDWKKWIKKRKRKK